ncbi:ribonucleotide reductase inhibitor-domain-containing protein [Microdochium trichocladiopsis]|uniref:Ribonucleotide reductase inhibitor-domain-containing protein n=1 Tax=Microdochium trichocladiopsis TaxID=1682393 RepID=A0A9P9BY22_9PEZI|nr:ribonucleotide reductase inhibitor-domain-containing protein [Microdochium trichocladiopsis]KAH7037618.1 ribonucleotide reductase inhibitor-domain-containing protein [Microdochium trichocladiopsis]
MAAPRTKRQFAGAASDPAQRQITAFFNSSATSSASSTSHVAHSVAQSNSPALPASVQSNLISVGMRVRKSVPEGYKTGTYSAFSLWDDANTTASSSFSTKKQNDFTGDYTAASSPERNRSRANAFSTPRELMPFCGIHRVGGLDVQPGWGSSSSHPQSHDSPLDDFDDLPGLTSSQESAVNTDSWAAAATNDIAETNNARKRFFVDEEDGVSSSSSTSTRSLAPMGWDNGRRVIAVPKKMRSRGKPALAGTPELAASFFAGHRASKLDQENVMVMDTDFEEADFLDQQKSWEVAMSDA